jgi:hypothetical protein
MKNTDTKKNTPIKDINISGFIKEVVSGNYASANKHLRDTVHSKIGAKIRKVKSTNIF